MLLTKQQSLNSTTDFLFGTGVS